MTSRWPPDPATEPTTTDGGALSSRGAQTRRRLLEAAESVFAEYGWEEASIVKITETAGVAHGTFYRYFPSKQAIFDELVEDLNRRVRRAMSEGAARGVTRAESERYGFEAFFQFTADHPALYRVIRQAEFASPSALHLHYDRIAKGYIEGISEAMERGEIAPGDPEVLAWALMGIGELVGMRWILWGGGERIPAEVLDQLTTFIQRGLGTTQ
jgi:AcrR family transcriptional regulator